MMKRYFQTIAGLLMAAFLVGGPASYAYYQRQFVRHFQVVRPHVLYRSGHASLAGLQRLFRDYGIRTVVTLRDAYFEGDKPRDVEEEAYCRAEEINYVRITPRPWSAPDGSVPADAGVRRFLAVMDNPENYPVLIHCFAGVHRTGAYCAVYRMEFEGWSHERAIAEMRAAGYCTLDQDKDVLAYIQNYRPRKLFKSMAP